MCCILCICDLLTGPECQPALLCAAAVCGYRCIVCHRSMCEQNDQGAACLPQAEYLAHCRDAFDHVVDRSLALVGFLKAQGPTVVHNMDNLLLRESMDVIGRHHLLFDARIAGGPCILVRGQYPLRHFSISRPP